MKKFLFFLFLFIINVNVYSQGCGTDFGVLVLDNTYQCDDNGTPNDPSDDFYFVDVYISHSQDPNGSWSSDNAGNNGEPYSAGPSFKFGPYARGTGVQTVIITDVNNPQCSETVQFEEPACMGCSDFTVSITKNSGAGCTASYELQIDGDFNGQLISNFNVVVKINGGVIVSYDDEVTGNYLLQGFQGQSGGDEFIVTSGGPTINGSDLWGSLTYTLIVEASDCVTFEVIETMPNILGPGTYNNVGFGLNPCYITSISLPQEGFCPEFVDLTGEISLLNQSAGDCPESEGLGIENAEVTISNTAGEEICQSLTDNSGSYNCSTCEEGPWEICVTTTCPEPCGLSDIDLQLYQLIILQYMDPPLGFEFTGDVHQNGSVTGPDVVSVRKAIFGKEDEFAPESWCRFVSTEEFLLHQQGLMPINSIDECVTVSNPNAAPDFIQFNLGDLNGSCDDCDHGPEDDDDDGVLTEGEIVVDGTTLKLYISPTVDSLHAYTVNLDVGNNELAEVSAITGDFDFGVEDGILKIIWFKEDLGAINVDGNPLVVLEFQDDLMEQVDLLNSELNYIITGQGCSTIEVQDRNSAESRSLEDEVLCTLNDKVSFTADFKGASSVSFMVRDIFGNLHYSKVHRVENGQVDIDWRNDWSGIYLVTTIFDRQMSTKKVYLPE